MLGGTLVPPSGSSPLHHPSPARDVPWRATRPGGQVVRTSRPRIPNRQCPGRTPRTRRVEPARRRAPRPDRPPGLHHKGPGPVAPPRRGAGSSRCRATRGRARPTPGVGRGRRVAPCRLRERPERRGQGRPAAECRKEAPAARPHDRRLPAAAQRKGAPAARRPGRRPVAAEPRKEAAAHRHARLRRPVPRGRPVRFCGAWSAG